MKLSILGWVIALQPFKMKKTSELFSIYNELEIPNNREISRVLSIGKKVFDFNTLKVRDKLNVENNKNQVNEKSYWRIV